MANVYIDDQDHYIVAACALCGRWRDALGEWITPPNLVTPMLDSKIIELTHGYCADCLREHNASLGGKIAIGIADRLEACMQLRPHDPDDFVYNLCVMGVGNGES